MARSPRNRATSAAEGRPRAIEDERVGLEVGHVEDLVDERGQAAARFVDAFDVGALLVGVEVEVEERLGVAADEGQWRAQLVADRGDEPLAQFLQRADRADVAQDRRRPARRSRRRPWPRSCRRPGPAPPARHGPPTPRRRSGRRRHGPGRAGRRPRRGHRRPRSPSTSAHDRPSASPGVEPEQLLAGRVETDDADPRRRPGRCSRSRRRRSRPGPVARGRAPRAAGRSRARPPARGGPAGRPAAPSSSSVRPVARPEDDRRLAARSSLRTTSASPVGRPVRAPRAQGRRGP